MSAQPKGGPIIQTDISTEIDGKRYYLLYSNLRAAVIDNALIAMKPVAYFGIEDGDIVKRFYDVTGVPKMVAGYQPCVVAATGTKLIFDIPGSFIHYHNFLFVHSDMDPVWLNRILRRQRAKWRLATESENTAFFDAIGNDKRSNMEKNSPETIIGLKRFVVTTIDPLKAGVPKVIIPGVWFSASTTRVTINGKEFLPVYSNLEVSKLEEVLSEGLVYSGRLASKAETEEYDRQQNGKKTMLN